MSKRKMKKMMKKQIAKLQSDNDLMCRIITDSPTMRELYDAYTKPLKVTYTKLPIQEVKVKRMIPVYMADYEGVIEHTKQALAKDLLERIKEDIVYEIDNEYGHKPASITASIFIGRK